MKHFEHELIKNLDSAQVTEFVGFIPKPLQTYKLYPFLLCAIVLNELHNRISHLWVDDIITIPLQKDRTSWTFKCLKVYDVRMVRVVSFLI